MSMFHELMMRKKEQIMYATIKGTLTENDGVFSGFSTSNYLEVQGLYDFSKPFEIKTKIHLNSNPNASSFIKIGGSAVIMISQTSAIGAYISANDGTTIFGANATPKNIISVNEDTFIRFVFTGTEYALYISTDDSNYTKYLIATSSKVIGNNELIILGANPPIQSFSIGTIDLNQTNIKLGSTKYKLQAVVGYTVVGSPTITDGVVSGFSGSDYLTLPNLPKTYNLEISFNFTTNTVNTQQQIINYGNYGGILINSNSKPRVTLTGTTVLDLNATTNLSENTNYTIKMILKNEVLAIEIYSTNGTLIERKTTETTLYSALQTVRIGKTQSGRVFFGSINLASNNTYIKVDNKLWFNGQEG